VRRCGGWWWKRRRQRKRPARRERGRGRRGSSGSGNCYVGAALKADSRSTRGCSRVLCRQVSVGVGWKRCDGWMAADGGRFVVEPSSVERERGLRAHGGLCDADQLGSQRGVFWGAGELKRSLSFLGPAAEECAVCDGAVNCLLSSLSILLNKAWQMVRGCAECRRVLQGVAVASETRELRAGDVVCLSSTHGSRGRWRSGRSRAEVRRVGYHRCAVVVAVQE
jgi:hypothetical protein